MFNNVPALLPTCVIYSIPHLKTADGALSIFIVALKDELQMSSDKRFYKKHTAY